MERARAGTEATVPAAPPSPSSQGLARAAAFGFPPGLPDSPLPFAEEPSAMRPQTLPPAALYPVPGRTDKICRTDR